MTDVPNSDGKDGIIPPGSTVASATSGSHDGQFHSRVNDRPTTFRITFNTRRDQTRGDFRGLRPFCTVRSFVSGRGPFREDPREELEALDCE